jgi:hypothetical protein
MSELNRRHFVMGASLTALQSARAMGANDRIGVAVIGCGSRGLLGESNVEVAALCDIWKQQRETACAKVQASGAAEPKLFVHCQEVLAAPGVDAVLISTPDRSTARSLPRRSRRRKTCTSKSLWPWT